MVKLICKQDGTSLPLTTRRCLHALQKGGYRKTHALLSIFGVFILFFSSVAAQQIRSNPEVKPEIATYRGHYIDLGISPYIRADLILTVSPIGDYDLHIPREEDRQISVAVTQVDKDVREEWSDNIELFQVKRSFTYPLRSGEMYKIFFKFSEIRKRYYIIAVLPSTEMEK